MKKFVLAVAALALTAGASMAQTVRIATEGEVVAVDGSVVPAPAGSLCVHGDSPGAVEIARRVRAGLDAAGVGVTPFAGEPT